MRKLFLPVILVALPASPATAELPAPVRAMLEAAVQSGDATKVAAVADVARTLHPGDAEEIAAITAPAPPVAELASAAPVPAEAAPQPAAEQRTPFLAGWSGEGQLGAFQSSGNTDALGLTAQLRLKRQVQAWEHNLRAAADYRRTNGDTDREQFSAAYEPRYQISDGLFAYGLSQVERDRVQGYSTRYALSGGLGYRLLAGEGLNLSVKAGPAWRRTHLVNGLAESSVAALAGLDFDWTISDRLKVTQDANAVAEAGGSAVAFIGGDSTSINLVTGLEGKISDQLSARLAWTMDYNSGAPEGAVATDTQTRFTLVYDF